MKVTRNKDNTIELNRNTGFTLIELLVVIAIIALLSSVIAASLVKARTKARDSSRIQNARQLSIALEQFEMANNSYKVVGSGYNNTGSGLASKSGTAEYTTSIVSKLKSLGLYSSDKLIDPQYGTDNYYVGICETSTSSKFNIFLKLEQKEIQHNESTIKSGCDGLNAFTLGFNHLFGMAITASSSASGSGSGSGGGGSITFGTPISITPSPFDIVESNGAALVKTATSKYAYSTDKANWGESSVLDSSSNAHDLEIVSFAPSPLGFLLIGRGSSDGNNFAYSTDGKVWNFPNVGQHVQWEGAGAHIGLYYAYGSMGPEGESRTIISTDGTNWVPALVGQDAEDTKNVYWSGAYTDNDNIVFDGTRDSTRFFVTCNQSGSCSYITN